MRIALGIGLLAWTVLSANVQPVCGSVLVNGDFETGDFTGWNFFLTADGTTSTPVVELYDVTGDGTSSLAARFRAGRDTGDAGDFAGGGILQSHFLAAGSYEFSADLASQSVVNFSNSGHGGLYELLVGSTVVDSVNLGFGTPALGAKRDSLFGTITITTPDVYDIGIRISRPHGPNSATTLQYIDNIRFASTATVPEPGSALVLGGLILFSGLGPRRRKQ